MANHDLLLEVALMAILDSGLKLINKYAPKGVMMVRPGEDSQEQQNEIIFVAKVVSRDSAFTLGIFRKRADAVARCRQWLADEIKWMTEHLSDWDDDDPFPNGIVEYYARLLSEVSEQEYKRNPNIDSPIIEEHPLE